MEVACRDSSTPMWSGQRQCLLRRSLPFAQRLGVSLEFCGLVNEPQNSSDQEYAPLRQLSVLGVGPVRNLVKMLPKTQNTKHTTGTLCNTPSTLGSTPDTLCGVSRGCLHAVQKPPPTLSLSFWSHGTHWTNRHRWPCQKADRLCKGRVRGRARRRHGVVSLNGHRRGRASVGCCVEPCGAAHGCAPLPPRAYIGPSCPS
mmetsp:Transcript_112984/g.196135  ORF Transcript_112984/g.196135 Transcript_112984/m.196135 type:complete len:200 (-) Transcript_112984:51-650(-)